MSETIRKSYIQFLINNYPYYANMVEIGQYVAHFGHIPPEFPVSSIRTLRMFMYHADVITGPRSATISLVKNDPKFWVEGYSLSRIPNIHLEVDSNGRVQIFAHRRKEPGVNSFEMPAGGRKVRYETTTGFLQINARTRNIGPVTQEFLTGLTNNALVAIRSLYPWQPILDDVSPRPTNPSELPFQLH